MNRVYALGYGDWQKLREFIDYLKALEVGVLVDVRRFPASKNPEFMGKNLEVELPKWGIKYEFMGETLGGFRRGGYRRHMDTDSYKDGIKQLLEMSKESSVAIMCVERSFKHCHRRFIMQTLSGVGANVIAAEGKNR